MSEAIRLMFARIADRYDLGNTVLSFGVHWWWKWQLVQFCQPKPQQQWLDCATGTGDVALLALRAMKKRGTVVGVDFCPPMLERARRRAHRRRDSITFVEADIQHLPFPDDSFDRATIAFGIRNVDNPLQAMEQMARVVKPGGIVGVLEFGQPTGWIALPYRWYSRTFLPRLGGWLSGDRSAYEYLYRSAQQFPCGPQFVAMMKQVEQFSTVEFRPLLGGIAFLYRGVVQ